MPKRGGKRVKKRTHVVDNENTEELDTPIPRSMVIRAPKTMLPHPLQVQNKLSIKLK